jgi:ParB-like chromosome segregation protein Spo0J
MADANLIPIPELHPACAAWPEMGAAELHDLADDIAANGQHDPIAMSPDGRIVEGRNRYLACVMAGLEPKTFVYDGDPWLLSISRNKHRRHMTTDQIALVVAQLVTARQGDNRFTAGETTIADAARLGDVPETAVKSARTVLQDGTEEEIADVRAGKAKARKTADRIRARKPKRGKPAPEAGEPEPNKPETNEAEAGSSSPEVEALRREHAEAVKALKLKHANDLVVSGNKRYAEGKKAGKEEGPKDRAPAPAFNSAELAQLREALHPDGKPDAFVEMHTAASALFNDRAHLLRKARRSKQ